MKKTLGLAFLFFILPAAVQAEDFKTFIGALSPTTLAPSTDYVVGYRPSGPSTIRFPLAQSAITDTTNAANISSGTLAAARGGAGTVNGALKANGSGAVSQAACGDLSNAAASCSTDATNAGNISSGVLGLGLMASNIQPQGRITLTSGVPVMNANATAQATVYYDCFNGPAVPYYNGTADLMDAVSGCEVSTAMQASSTGVLNSGDNFDLWWVHGGANRICFATNGTGGGWSSDTAGSTTARGTGYTQLHNTRGYYTNVNAIAHCYNGATDYGSISADQATYLGTIFTSAAGQTGWAPRPTAASGGAAALLYVYNAYNRQLVKATSIDNKANWTWNSSTFHSVDASNNNRVTWVDGLMQSYSSCANTSIPTFNATNVQVGCAVDATNVSGDQPGNISSAQTQSIGGASTAFPQMGLHFFQAVESSGSGTTTINGPNVLVVEMAM